MRPQGPREVARHELTTPGGPSICDEHYPPRPAGAVGAQAPSPQREEREFLAIGEGAERWLKRAAAEGTQRIRRKMAEAVDLAKLHGAGAVKTRLSGAPSYGRFADGDLASILAHQQTATVIPLPKRAPEERSLQARPAAGRDSADDQLHDCRHLAGRSTAQLLTRSAVAGTRSTAGRRPVILSRPGHDRRSGRGPIRPAARDRAAGAAKARELAFEQLELAEHAEPTGSAAMTVKPPAPPPLPDELDRLLDVCGCRTFAVRRRR